MTNKKKQCFFTPKHKCGNTERTIRVIGEIAIEYPIYTCTYGERENCKRWIIASKNKNNFIQIMVGYCTIHHVAKKET